MLNQAIKSLYFELARFVTLPGGVIARRRFRRTANGEGHYLHLGCGEHYIDGMVNIDGNLARRKDVWWDLRNRLPFGDSTVRFVYCSHTLEHFYPEEALNLLRDIKRLLRSDGVCRIAVPSIEHALEIARGEATSDWPRPFEDRLAQAINYLFCDGQHKYAYSFGLLSEFAKSAGFTKIVQRSAISGLTPTTYGRVTVGDEPLGSLVVELSL